MDEKQAERALKSNAAMKIGDEFSENLPPQREASTRTGRRVLWLPVEALPRYAKMLRDRERCDVAVGDVAYYAWSDNSGYLKKGRGRKRFRWSISDLVLEDMTMEVTCVQRRDKRKSEFSRPGRTDTPLGDSTGLAEMGTCSGRIPGTSRVERLYKQSVNSDGGIAAL
jgi:hypothetical protein